MPIIAACYDRDMNKQTLVVVVAALGVLIVGLVIGKFAGSPQPAVVTSVSPSPTAIASTEPVGSSTPVPTVVPTAAPSATPVVIFKSEGSIPASDKSQLQARVISPFIDYSADTRSEAKLVSMTVTPKADLSTYTVDYIFSDNVNGGFVIEKTDGQIAWWLPECLGTCPFSASFKTKYPEIIKKFE